MDRSKMYWEPGIIHYFAGNGSKHNNELKRKLGCSQLYSQLNERGHIIHWVNFLRENPDYEGHLFVDSGAYSAYTKGKVVDVDDYINFINETGDVVRCFAQVDKIPQVIGREPTEEELADAPRQSWENYLYMISKIKPEYVDKLLPVFHFQEDTKWLKNMLEWTHPEDGRHIPYIGLAASTVDSAESRRQWLDMCFGIIKSSSNPNVMTHGFGTTALDVVEQFPLTSVDSTTWIQLAAHGAIIVDKKPVIISDRRPKESKNALWASPAIKESISQKVAEYGFDLHELASNASMRGDYNITYLKKWQDNYKLRESTTFKKVLW